MSYGVGNAFQASQQTYNQVQQTDQDLAGQGNDIYDAAVDGAFGQSGASGSSSDNIAGGQQGMMQILEMELQLLMATLEQMMGQGQQSQGGGSSQGSDPEQHVDQASGSSWGDPHQSFSGSDGSQNLSGSSNHMGSLRDLVDANDSIAGGYQVSTKTTKPDANGISYNESATITFGDGNDTLKMGKDGVVTVSSGDNSIQLQKGQSGTLDGATISEDQNGVVTVADQDAAGGLISTSLAWNGKGVDVHFTASNIDLGGYDVGLSDPSSKSSNGVMNIVG